MISMCHNSSTGISAAMRGKRGRGKEEEERKRGGGGREEEGGEEGGRRERGD